MGRRLASLADRGKNSAQNTATHFQTTLATKLLVLLAGVGAVLLIVAAVLDSRGIGVPGNGLRWLYLFGAVLCAMLLWNGLVDLAHNRLEAWDGADS
ncbi:hypothetical protein GPECTOR_5g133 [Gonium pectorale]|uniref:Uncharacterized protein n=1 Tax=Gonium pectorale TaxID=33097 RepID=A0A150GW89_GONPE|nr:hypothetical protein GPECTOR_5g133 [Gonium pectorale]|eukprot:KXZ54023.1 hypothetical protein GPECTOR_5g133 [Gonium pectorale]